MGFKVFLSGTALSDLEAIVAYIAPEDPQAAGRLGDHLLNEAMSLETFPNRGRVIPEFSNSELREILFRSYRIVYRVETASRSVEILRFWHAARGAPGFETSDGT
jgi:plasmid stabilization system protein ParE